MGADPVNAPGAPGIAPTWTSSAKDLVTTALGPSRLWATLGHGIVNEVYYPSTGQPQIRDLGFIVATEGGWAEVKRVARYRLTTPAPTVPLPTIVHEGDGYRLTLEVLPDPERETLLERYRLEGEDARLYPLLAPHLGANGADNDAWLDDRGALCARGGAEALALVSDAGFTRRSVGYVGASDGWQDFARHGAMTWTFDRADHGNVALMGELPDAEGVLALGLAETAEGASTRARSSLAHGFANARSAFVEAWKAWGATLTPPSLPKELADEALLSATVLKVHEDKAFPGAVVASLSIPWGNARDDLGGYHLVWARDAVETGLGLLAAGQQKDARRMLAYLIGTQQPDGHWTQNMFPDGRSFWTGVQLDEVGFPLLLAAKLREHDALDDLQGVEAMVRAAAGFLARTGPLTPQDRWEENAGANPFTLAVEVAALVAAGPFLDSDERAYATSLADCWNERIEDWTYVDDGPLAAQHAIDGYYLRIAPPPSSGGMRGRIDVRNRAGDQIDAAGLVSLDYLALVRLGLRSPFDPRIQATTALVDALLAVPLPTGTAYHRYNDDGYGEHTDGSPFDGTGIGRAWPLLAGERAHLNLQQGDDPLAGLQTMAAMTGPAGLIPEQVWDADPVPERFLEPGKPSGSAMPLVWAHAEFLKLAFARDAGDPLELLDAVVERYDRTRPEAVCWHWRETVPFDELPKGRALQIERATPFTLHVGFDGWQRARDRGATALPFGMYGLRLEPEELARRSTIEFTLRDNATGAWSPDFQVTLGAAGPRGRLATSEGLAAR
ncbi:MAG: glycoside hydrolase family 15 protein [Deinococcales bacterium]